VTTHNIHRRKISLVYTEYADRNSHKKVRHIHIQIHRETERDAGHARTPE
jgi:hypothetical protein